VLESVLRDEGRRVDDGHHRVILTGSREWGEERPDQPGFPQEWVRHELAVSAAVVGRLVDRWFQGIVNPGGPRDRKTVPGPGLTLIQGGAPGLDTRISNAAKITALGLHRRSLEEYRRRQPTYGEMLDDGEDLADGFRLETYRADWSRGKQAGNERNQQMLDSGADHVIAFFAHGRAYGANASGGTNDMVRRAVAAGVTVDIYVANDRRWRKP